MRKEYKIGLKENKIHILVKIGTPGMANTKIFQFLPGGQYKLLTESNVDTANIEKTFIGTGEDLENSYLKIRTVIDFGSIDKSQWEQLNENIVAKCGLSGGFLGEQSYSYDEDDKTSSDNGRIVVIDIEVALKL